MTDTPPKSNPSRALMITAGVFVSSLTIFAVGSFAWAQQYQGRIAPNVTVGGIDVGGMDPEAALQTVQKQADTVMTDGVIITLDDAEKNLPLSTLIGAQMVEHVELDLETAIEQAAQAAHDEHPLIDTVRLVWNVRAPVEIRVPVSLDPERIRADVRNLFPDTEEPRKNASLHFTQTTSGWHVSVEPGMRGQGFHFDAFEQTLRDRLSRLNNTVPIALERSLREPSVSEEEAKTVVPRAKIALANAPYTFTFTEHDTTTEWHVNDAELAGMLEPQKTPHNTVVLSVAEEPFNTFLDVPADTIEQTAQDARFQIEDGRVKEFVGSRPGRSLDRSAVKTAFQTRINADVDAGDEKSDESIVLKTQTTEPDITTDEVNDLGITEKLGVGTSSFAGSPPNRIHNIQNGVKLLNGILIKPDETFSLIDALKPFTISNGYLPELVIKGDKIEPELGGGLCQIGTTTFRASMNSALPIAERRNHSLVVSYYNDPSNGNPGTDATLYDPAPDFKFTNDTGNHVLFQAEAILSTGQLRFTFWGTSDGREGSYTPPIVHRWIPTGAPKEIKTTKLAPGQRKCQGAHTGADASFTYTVVQPDGEVEERVFSSHYRPLPQICLVGVTEEELNGEESSEETPEDETETTDAEETDEEATQTNADDTDDITDDSDAEPIETSDATEGALE